MVRTRYLALLALAVSGIAHGEVRYHVVGLSGEEKSNVRAYLEAGNFDLAPDASELRRQNFHQRIAREARRALEPFGRYSPRIEVNSVPRKNRWRIDITVDPGPVVAWRELDVQAVGAGKDEPLIREVLDALPMRTGQPARHDQYEQVKTRLRRAAADQGYMDAQYLESEIRINREAQAADVRLVLDTGERFHFGPLLMEQDVIDDDLLRRYINIQEGEHYSSQRLLIAKQTLYATDFFSSVDLDADREEAVDGRVPIRVSAEKSKRHRYGLGLGYGTDTSYRVSGNWTLRRINKAGHNLSLDARYSPIKYSFSSAYTIPIGNPALERIMLTGGTVDEELGDLDSHRIFGAATVVRVPGKWQRQLALTYLNESSGLVTEVRHDQYWVPSVRMMRSWSDTKIGPLRGFQLLGNLQASGTGLGLESNFVQASLRARLVFPVSTRGKVLLRGEGGSTWTDDFDRLPASRRFFAGGDDSIRGYSFNSVSPRNPDGYAVGGRHLLTGSVEYNHFLSQDWGVAVFSDTGYAFNRLSDPLETSVGVGLRWNSPVGTVSIDLAQSVSDRDRSPRLHISVGPRL